MNEDNSSIQHALEILEALRQNPKGLSTAELLKCINIPRSSFFYLINTLKSLGYVEQRNKRSNYLAGSKLRSWTYTVPPMWYEWRDIFEQEASLRELEETLALVFPHPLGIQIAAQIPSKQRVRTVFEIGEVISGQECAAISLFSSPVPEAIRHNSYSLLEGAEVCELAVPICADGYHPSAALLLSAPQVRHTKQSILVFLPIVREIAMRISYRLGAPNYLPYNHPQQSTFVNERPLDNQELSNFLRNPYVARLACLTPEGKPHVIPVWQEWDGKAFYVAAWQGSQWAVYLRTNPTVSLTVDEPWSPMRRVVAHGEAILLGENDYPGGVNALVKRLQRRYLGEAFREHRGAKNWQAFRIQPQTMRGWKGLSLTK